MHLVNDNDQVQWSCPLQREQQLLDPILRVTLFDHQGAATRSFELGERAVNEPKLVEGVLRDQSARLPFLQARLNGSTHTPQQSTPALKIRGSGRLVEPEQPVDFPRWVRKRSNEVHEAWLA